MKEYRVSNLNEIAILFALNKKFVGLDKADSRRIEFIFQDSGCEDSIKSFYNGQKLTSPWDFAEGLKKAKDILFGHKGEEKHD